MSKAGDVGAVVTFSGICRDEQGSLTALELEHYPGMAEAEIMRIARQAAERWPLAGLTAIHRHGKIRPGENIVLVVAASKHRRAAFEAADFLMDYLKSRAPVLEKGASRGRVRRRLGRRQGDRRTGRGALEEIARPPLWSSSSGLSRGSDRGWRSWAAAISTLFRIDRLGQQILGTSPMDATLSEGIPTSPKIYFSRHGEATEPTQSLWTLAADDRRTIECSASWRNCSFSGSLRWSSAAC